VIGGELAVSARPHGAGAFQQVGGAGVIPQARPIPINRIRRSRQINTVASVR